MSDERTLNILKESILLEKRGEMFYQFVAEQTENKILKEFFKQMAKEEKYHEKVLGEHYRKVKKSGNFSPEIEKDEVKPLENILNNEIIKEISAAGNEAAAISAAMALEQNSIKTYEKRAQETEDPSEKKLYNWLVEWEKTHLEYLVFLDNELREKIWYDNKFWPM